MQSMLKHISEFKNKVKFISDELGLLSRYIESKPMTKEEKYSLIEPYIEMLILSSSTGDENSASLSMNNKSVPIKPKYKKLADLVEAGEKIRAIKLLREYFSSSLKEAKNEVERVYNFPYQRWLVDKWEYDGELIWKK